MEHPNHAKKSRSERRFKHVNRARNLNRRPRINEGQLLNGLIMKYFPKTYVLNPCFFPSSQAPAGSHRRRKPTVQGSEKAPEAN
jgi:hypothetical protein